MLSETLTTDMSEFYSVINDISLMRDEPSFEPCYEVNPELWRLFCRMNNREFAPNHVWSEMDVVLWIDEHEMKKENTARIAKLNLLISKMNLSRQSAAEIIGVQERTIYRWLSGERNIPDFVLHTLHYANLLHENGIKIEPPDDIA